MAAATIRVNLGDMPAIVWRLRQAMADVLRAEAEGEPEFTARKLREIAARFEAGISEGAEGAGDG